MTAMNTCHIGAAITLRKKTPLPAKFIWSKRTFACISRAQTYNF